MKIVAYYSPYSSRTDLIISAPSGELIIIPFSEALLLASIITGTSFDLISPGIDSQDNFEDLGEDPKNGIKSSNLSASCGKYNKLGKTP